jgi:hypothetical protein
VSSLPQYKKKKVTAGSFIAGNLLLLKTIFPKRFFFSNYNQYVILEKLKFSGPKNLVEFLTTIPRILGPVDVPSLTVYTPSAKMPPVNFTKDVKPANFSEVVSKGTSLWKLSEKKGVDSEDRLKHQVCIDTGAELYRIFGKPSHKDTMDLLARFTDTREKISEELHLWPRVVSSILAAWASSSTSPNSCATQFSVQEEFKTKAGVGSFWSKTLAKGAKIRESKSPQIVRQVQKETVKAIYSRTQKILKEMGIKGLILYRGMHLEKKGHEALYRDQISVNDFFLNPLSSFSTSFGTATDFGDVVLARYFPADQIFACPKTGLGCLDEEEVVVLGGRYTFQVFNQKVDDKVSFSPAGVKAAQDLQKIVNRQGTILKYPPGYFITTSTVSELISTYAKWHPIPDGVDEVEWMRTIDDLISDYLDAWRRGAHLRLDVYHDLRTGIQNWDANHVDKDDLLRIKNFLKYAGDPGFTKTEKISGKKVTFHVGSLRELVQQSSVKFKKKWLQWIDADQQLWGKLPKDKLELCLSDLERQDKKSKNPEKKVTEALKSLYGAKGKTQASLTASPAGKSSVENIDDSEENEDWIKHLPSDTEPTNVDNDPRNADWIKEVERLRKDERSKKSETGSVRRLRSLI